MPIVINHAPDISLVGSVAHGAGRGEYDKWVYQQNVQREAEKTQAFLSAFGQFSSFGLQAAQMRQNKQIANRRMDIYEKQISARTNAAKVQASQQAARELAQYEDLRMPMEQAEAYMFPSNFFQSDELNARNQRMRESWSGVGPGHARFQQRLKNFQAYEQYQAKRSLNDGIPFSRQSNVARGTLGRQSYRNDAYVTDNLMPRFRAEMDKVLDHLPTDQFAIPGNPRTRGRYRPGGMGGDYGPPISPEIAHKQIEGLRQKYRAEYDLHRKQSPNAIEQYWQNHTLISPVTGEVINRQTGRIEPGPKPPGAPETIFLNEWNEDKTSQYTAQYGEHKQQHESAWDDGQKEADRKRSLAEKNAAQAKAALNTAQEAYLAKGGDPEGFDLAGQTAAIDSKLNDALATIEAERKRVFGRFKGSPQDPTTGLDWTRTFTGTPSHKFFQRQKAMGQLPSGATMGLYEGELHRPGMTREEMRDVENWRVPPNAPSTHSRFTQHRLRRDMGRFSEAHPESPTAHVYRWAYPKPPTDRTTQINQSTAEFMSQSGSSRLGQADTRPEGAGRSMHYIEGAPGYLQRPYEPNFGERLLGMGGPYDDRVEPEPSAGWEDGKPLGPVGRPLPSGVISPEPGYTSTRRSTQGRTPISKDITFVQELDAIGDQFAGDEQTTKDVALLKATMDSDKHWTKTGRGLVINSRNWSREEIDALKRIAGRRANMDGPLFRKKKPFLIDGKLERR